MLDLLNNILVFVCCIFAIDSELNLFFILTIVTYLKLDRFIFLVKIRKLIAGIKVIEYFAKASS